MKKKCEKHANRFECNCQTCEDLKLLFWPHPVLLQNEIWLHVHITYMYLSLSLLSLSLYFYLYLSISLYLTLSLLSTARKKKVEIVLAGSDINKIEYETTLMEENNRRKRGKRINMINHSIRNLRRMDFNFIPSVSHEVLLLLLFIYLLPLTCYFLDFKLFFFFQSVVYFTGKRLRTKEDLNLEMYRSELQVRGN